MAQLTAAPEREHAGLSRTFYFAVRPVQPSKDLEPMVEEDLHDPENELGLQPGFG